MEKWEGLMSLEEKVGRMRMGRLFFFFIALAVGLADGIGSLRQKPLER